MNNISSYPAHFPYQDSWKFCEVCQRFYKNDSDFCSVCQSKGRDKNRKSTKSKTKTGLKMVHKVWNNGLGLPTWTRMKEFVNSPDGEESVKRFRATQESIRNKIETASENKEITYGELGADNFKKHWFIKKVIV